MPPAPWPSDKEKRFQECPYTLTLIGVGKLIKFCLKSSAHCLMTPTEISVITFEYVQ